MASEVWRWQNDNVSSFNAEAVLSDGSLLVAGYEADAVEFDRDFAVFKLDPSDGSVSRKWKAESNGTDTIHAAAAGSDGSFVLGGYTEGNWSRVNEGLDDYAALKFDSDMEVVWRLQGGTEGWDYFYGVGLGQDESVYLGGQLFNVFLLVKVHSNGTVLWQWTGDSGGWDGVFAMVMAGEDDSVVLAGSTQGDWSGTNSGGLWDFAAVKLDSDGEELWRWQDGTDEVDYVESVVAAEDGSVIIAGYTEGSFDGSNAGEADFVAIKLDADGTELWRWQDGTSENEAIHTSALGEDGFVVMAGFTEGDWNGTNKGESDFMAVKLDASDGSTEAWRWQDGTSTSESIRAIVEVSSESMVLSGATFGSFGRDHTSLSEEGVVLMLETGFSTPAPAPAPGPTSLSSSNSAAGPIEASTPSPLVGPGGSSSSLTAAAPASTPSPLPGAESPTATGVPPADSSGSSSPTLVIAVIVSAVAVVVLLGLVFCRRRIRACLGKRCSADKVAGGALPGGRGGPASTVRPDASGDDLEGKAVPRGNVKVGSHPEIYGGEVIRDEKGVQPGHGGYLSMGLPSAEAPATGVGQPLSAVVTVPPPVSTAVMLEGASRSSPPYGVAGSEPHADLDKGIDVVGANPVVPSAPLLVAAPTPALPFDSAEENVVASLGTVGGSSKGEGDVESGGGTGVRVGVAQAILEAAQEVGEATMIPGVSEAAALVSVLVRLVADDRECGSAADGRLRWCRSIVALLGRAAELLSKGGQLLDEADRVLLEEVRESIDDLVQLIQIYKRKNRMVRVMTSTLFRRRQEELESSINLAVNRLQVGLQVHGGHKLDAVGQDVKNILEGQSQSSEKAFSEGMKVALAESRRKRRQRRLEQLEIPEDQLTLTNELLGKGGFGAVYMAGLNGRNAAAKIVEVEHDLRGPGGSLGHDGMSDEQSSEDIQERQRSQRRAFMRELEAMTRLRSPYTVHVYGAVTSRSDRLILVMELMSGGDLRTFLKDAPGPIEEERARRIVGEVCAGMAFLHGKHTVHGDLKSANVLFDGYGRAKICDFGTSRWTQHTTSTGLATQTDKGNHSTQMSLPWAAPEVLNKRERSLKSDVYSFGMVVWEVLTRRVPWGDEPEILEVCVRVVFKEERPDIPEEAPADLAEFVRSCWVTDPMKRPSFESILERMKSSGWKEA